MERNELDLLFEALLQHEKIANLPDLQSKLLSTHKETRQADGTLIVTFAFYYAHNLAITEYGRFYGYKKTLVFKGRATLRKDSTVEDLHLDLTNLDYTLKTNADPKDTERYSNEYKLIDDLFLSTIAPILHEKSDRGPPQFCQFDQIYVQEIEPRDDESTTYHLIYVFDVDGFSQYDKTITFEGYIKVDEKGNPVESKLPEIERGVGL